MTRDYTATDKYKTTRRQLLMLRIDDRHLHCNYLRIMAPTTVNGGDAIPGMEEADKAPEGVILPPKDIRGEFPPPSLRLD